MSENKDNKLTLINEKTANDYLTHTFAKVILHNFVKSAMIIIGLETSFTEINIYLRSEISRSNSLQRGYDTK